MQFLSSDIYGADPTSAYQQPTGDAVPHHLGQPEPIAKTRPDAPKTQSPALAVVALIAIAIVLSQVTFSGTVKVTG